MAGSGKVVGGIVLAACLLLAAPAAAFDGAAIGGVRDDAQGPIVGEAAVPGSSRAARDLPVVTAGRSTRKASHARQNPLRDEPDQGRRGTWSRESVPFDPLLLVPHAPLRSSPGLDLAFDATGNPAGCGTCTPPDPVGDVGPHHYVHMVNATKVAIYDKLGNLAVGPFNLGTLWSSAPCTGNAGDGVVLYDPIADRWLLSQFASPNHMCVAISQTADPTGAYFTYTFNVGSFPDYFKFGVWPDGYYMSANEATYTAYAFDRAQMLLGAAATFQKFTGGTNFYLPSDLDGPALPPAGAPNPFYTFKDNSFHGGNDRLEVREFHVDWVTPANSTFSLVATLPIAAFTYTPCGFFNFNCIRQSATAQRFDALGEWPLFRFPYRNFTTHQSLAGTFVVGGGLGEVGAAIRWFELRKSGAGWTLYQEGTHDPGDGHDRTNASIAIDRRGDIALGFTVSSSGLHPGIRYATRLAGDPLGTLQAEAGMVAGGGSQTGSNRWGDYAAMSVDPADDCTFWYTNEYYSADSANQWRTRVGAFVVPECLPAADLAIDQAVVVTKGLALYTLTVRNQGPDSASGVTLSDPLPAGARFVQHSTSQGTCTTPAVGATGTVSCALGPLASGATATIHITVQVDTQGRRFPTVLRNTATVTGGPGDPDLTDNASTVETPLGRPTSRR